MLTLRRGRQPSRTRNAFFIHEALDQVLGDDEEVFDRGETCVFFGGTAVDVGTTQGVVLDYRSSDLTGVRRGVGDDIKRATWPVDGTGVGKNSGFRCGKRIGIGHGRLDVGMRAGGLVTMGVRHGGIVGGSEALVACSIMLQVFDGFEHLWMRDQEKALLVRTKRSNDRVACSLRCRLLSFPLKNPLELDLSLLALFPSLAHFSC